MKRKGRPPPSFQLESTSIILKDYYIYVVAKFGQSIVDL